MKKVPSMTAVRSVLGPLAWVIHDTAVQKGFYENEEVSIDMLASEKIALMHSEVSEILEARRRNDEVGEAEEVADSIIRLLDYAQWRGMDLSRAIVTKVAKNKTRPRLHGKAF